MLKIQENVDIKDYSTFRIGGIFRYFIEINSMEDLDSLYADVLNNINYKNIPIFILGSGSNCIFREGVLDILAIKINIEGFEIISENDEFVDIKIGAGEITDEMVEKTLKMNLSGMESLSAVPGTIGATPIQNVGAYGVEVSNLIISVEVFDILNGELKSLSNTECRFGYRDSIFKNEAKGKYIVTNVVFRFNRVKDNKELFNKRIEIINTRWSKLPKPEEIPNVGSFFKNPIVPKEKALNILKNYPEAKFFPIDENNTKIPAGWLIEQSGLKGKSFGKITVYAKNALILTNTGEATQTDVENAKNEIVKIVKEKFDIVLEQEPEVI